MFPLPAKDFSAFDGVWEDFQVTINRDFQETIAQEGLNYRHIFLKRLFDFRLNYLQFN